MDNKIIIAIGRQYGSGGAEIGRMLSKQMEIPFYDKELLTEAAKNSGYSEALFEQRDERKTGSLLFSLSTGSFSLGGGSSYYYNLPLDDKLFLAQIDVMKKIAAEGSCIIIGRCAEYILRDDPACLSVFIHASMENRVKRITRLYQMTDAKAHSLINKTDKRRSQYHNYYSTDQWGEATSYHLCLDSGALGLEKTAAIIRAVAEIKVRGKNLTAG